MPPKKLILNPPKTPSQQPTPRIKFTNLNKDMPQPSTSAQEEAGHQQDEPVRAVSRGQAIASTEPSAKMTPQATADRDSPHLAATTAVNVEDGTNRSASTTPTGATDGRGNMPHDSDMTDAPPNEEQSGPPVPDNQKLTQDVASASSMQPPAAIPQQSQPVQVAHPPPARPTQQITTAFDRIMRVAGKGKASLSC